MRHFFPPWKQNMRNTCCSQQASWVWLEIPCISAHALIWQRLFYKLLQIYKSWILNENVMVVHKGHSEDIKITAVNCSLNFSLLSWLEISPQEGRRGGEPPQGHSAMSGPANIGFFAQWAGTARYFLHWIWYRESGQLGTPELHLELLSPGSLPKTPAA